MTIAHSAPQMANMKIEELPELMTTVAIAGSSKHQEVGGVICIGIAAGIAIYVAN